MLRLASIAASAVLLLGADISGVSPLRPQNNQNNQHVDFPPGENLPALPDLTPASDQTQTPQGGVSDKKSDNASGKPSRKGPDPSKDELQPMSRLSLVRYVDGEFARVVQPLPAGKKGFHMKAGIPLDEKELRMALGSSGAAVNPGDRAQITALEFKDREIVVDINGGGRGKKRLRDRIHLEVGGIPNLQTQTDTPDVPVNTNVGATLYLDFDKSVPDMTPDELKEYLSSMLDFSKQHSAAVQWVDSLPTDIQNAIKDKRPMVGMDREMVQAAIGRPDRKVREKGPDGNEIEDWIYGKPPAKTVFVKFEGEKVVQVEQFPQ